MQAVAKAGYRAIAPDFRGYGLSEQPKDLENAKWEDLIEDLLLILDSLQIPKVFLVGKDFGAMPAYEFAVHHPDRVLGVVTLGIPFSPAGFGIDLLPEGFYILRWREPGRAEADFGRFDVKTVIRNVYILFSSSEIPIATDANQEIMDIVDPATPLPSWFTEEDLQVYADLYQKSGFKFPLQVPYRILKGPGEGEVDLNSLPKVEVPTLLIMGEKDYCFKFPGMEDYVRSGMVKHFVPDLEIIYMSEGSHFVHEQSPDEVNSHILNFLDARIPQNV